VGPGKGEPGMDLGDAGRQDGGVSHQLGETTEGCDFNE